MNAVHAGPYELEPQQSQHPQIGAFTYYQSGTPKTGKPSLVLIHGLGNYAQMWFKMMDALGEQLHSVAIDLPGHGSAADLKDEQVTFTTFATYLDAIVQTVIQGPFILVGHSMGGLVSMRYTLDCAARQALGMVLLAPAGFETWTEKDRQWLAAIYRPGILMKLGKRRMEGQFKGNFVKFPADADHFLADIGSLKSDPAEYAAHCTALCTCARAIFADEISEHWHEITLPTLVCFGEADSMVPHPVLHPKQDLRKICQEVVATMPAARLRFLPGAGHLLQWEAAEVLAADILAFVNDLMVKN